MKSFLPFFFICTLLINTGCKKKSESLCTENNRGIINFTAQEKLIHPYGIHDSLVYFNAVLNNTVSFTCNVQTSYYQTFSEHDPNGQNYSGCPGDYYKTEVYITRFNPSTDRMIYIAQHVKNPFDTLQKENTIQIGISIPGNSIHPFYGYYAFRKDTLLNSKPSPYPGIDEFYDTITLENKLYHNVYLLEGLHSPPGSECISTIYYSISDGILKFSTNWNNVWSIQKKFILH